MKISLRYVTPQAGIILLAGLFTVDVSVLSTFGKTPGDYAAWLWNFGYSFLLALWVRVDRRSQNYDVPFEYDAFVFFAWPFVMPYYLYRTRGTKGWWYGVGLWAIYLAPFVIAGIVKGITVL